MRRLTRRATTKVPPDEKEIPLSTGLLQSSHFNRTSKTIWNATFQNADFTRHSALRCRTACDPGKSLLRSASRDLFGNRGRETKLEPSVRCANETPEPNSYRHSDPTAITNTNTNTNEDSTAITNTNSDSNRDRNGNVYSDPYGYIHSNTDSNCHSHSYVHAESDGDCNRHGNSRSHSYSNPYCDGGCASFAWRH